MDPIAASHSQSRQRAAWNEPRFSLDWRSLFAPAALYFLCLAMCGGGLTVWKTAYAFLIVVTVVAALILAWRDGYAILSSLPLAARLAFLGIAILPLLQLVPLPPALWHALPGHELREQMLRLVGLEDSWQPLSLEPVSTALTAILGLGFIVFMTMILQLNDTEFEALLLLAQGVVLFGILTGLSQVVTDGQFPNFHDVNTGGTLLGFYANKNHMALIIACSIPLFCLIVSRKVFRKRRVRLIKLGYIVFAMVCIIATNSRAGVVLGLLACLLVLVDRSDRMPLRSVLLGGVAVTAIICVVMATNAFEVVSHRFVDVDDDARWNFVAWSWPLVERYGWWGSGVGSFPALFAAHEQLSWVRPTLVNHVHDEYVQMVIEFGVPGCTVLAMLAISLLRPLRRLFSLKNSDRDYFQMWFGFIVILLFALHDFVDYPLRRPAGWVFFALALASVYRSGLHRTDPHANAGPDMKPA